MKRVSVLLIAIAGLALSVSGFASRHTQQPVTGSDDARKAIANALVKARASKRYVLLNFGAYWCGECRLMSKILAEPEIAKFLETNFVAVKVEVGDRVGVKSSSKNKETVLKYGAFETPESVAIPFMVILDGDGKVLARTNDGEWRHAPAITPETVLKALKGWAPKR